MSGRETWSEAQLAVERAEEAARAADVDERRDLERHLGDDAAAPRIFYGYGVGGEYAGISLEAAPIRHVIFDPYGVADPYGVTSGDSRTGAGGWPIRRSHSERWWALQRWAERADADLRERFPWHESLPEVQDWRERVLGPQRRPWGRGVL